MEQPFSKQICELADNMGIALFQRFSIVEASLFLRCRIEELEKLVAKRHIEYIQLPSQVDFFGYQLVQYLQNNIQETKSASISNSSELDRIISVKEVQDLTGLSRTSIWRLERSCEGKFPARVQLSSTRIGWRLSDIQKWIQSC